MGKKILDSKILYIFLSIIVSVALWVYVTSQDGNEQPWTISNIPITFTGVESLEQRGLMIVDNSPTASVRVSASPMVLAKLNRDNVRLIVNVATMQIEEPAQYTQAYTLSLPNEVQNQVQVLSGATGNVTFTVARYSTRRVEIRGEFDGTLAEGYLGGALDEFIFSPEWLTISGQAELVNQVSYAKVVVGGSDLTETVNGEFPYELIGASENVLTGLDIECDSESIYATYPILATAEIPLEVRLTPGGGVSGATVQYTLSANSIRVAGSKSAIAGISGSPHVIATVDLAAIRDGDVITYPIPLADELQNLSGITEVTVTFSLDPSLKTKTIGAHDIEYISLPDGWRADIVTQVVAVEVRGTEELVDAVIEDNLHVVIDLSNVANMAAGQYQVPAKVYLDSVGTSDQVGVVGTDYRVVVTLSPE